MNRIFSKIIIACSLATSLVACDFFKNKEGRRSPSRRDLAEKFTPEFLEMAELGRKIFVETPRYIGPKGSLVKQPANGMSCQNCHLDAGRREYALPVTSTFIRYPNWSSRMGRVVDIQDRINSCFVNPLNSVALDPKSREMLGLVSYFRKLYVETPGNLGALVEIKFPDRAADPARGVEIYKQHCQRCHQPNGGGVRNADGIGFVYPPVWGKDSFVKGVSMQQTILLARFIKGNMPFGITPDKPLLNDEQALDVAAFLVYSRIAERPDQKSSGQNVFADRQMARKPIDHPSGPYLDPFSEEQHRLGPYQPIVDWYKKKGIEPRFNR